MFKLGSFKKIYSSLSQMLKSHQVKSSIFKHTKVSDLKSISNTIINLSLPIFKFQRRLSTWTLFQNTMTVAKPEFEDDGKLFSGLLI